MTIKTQIKMAVKRTIRYNKPVLGPDASGGPNYSKYTLVFVVNPGFDIYKTNASTRITLGFCHGFAEIGVKYQLVSVYDLIKKIPEYSKPIIFDLIHSYLYYNKKERNILREYPHIVWVNADEKYYIKAYQQFEYKYQGVTKKIYDWVVDSQPTFVFTPSPPGALEYFKEWRKRGLRVESIPLACDTSIYYPVEKNRKFSDVKMAFVGGYWQKKAYFLDRYLKPYEEILTVYGYSKWPYSGYKGLLDSFDEKLLYNSAILSPAIDEPHAAVMGDIVERVFKIMGSGGVALPNAVKFYRELFQEDELYLPENEKDFHEMVETLLNDEETNSTFRRKGYDAILNRHTYAHRAHQIMSLLKFDL